MRCDEHGRKQTRCFFHGTEALVAQANASRKWNAAHVGLTPLSQAKLAPRIVKTSEIG
jgi:hypothetical protein